MTRVLLEQDIRGRSRRPSATRRSSGSSRSRADTRSGGRNLPQNRILASPDDRHERREALKTYLLGLAVIALVTAAVVVVPLLRAGASDTGTVADPAGLPAGLPAADSTVDSPTSHVDGPAGLPAELPAGSSTDTAAATTQTTADDEREIELAAVTTGYELPLVTFERSEPEEYLVEDGETLSEIAAMYDLEWDYLARFNGLTNPDRLKAGQSIMIPPESDTLLQSKQP